MAENHLRQQIRNHVGSILTGMPTAKTNVHKQRRYPLGAEQLPALLIYINDEAAEDSSKTKTGDIRRAVDLELVVACVAGKDGTPADLVDEMAAEVEEALMADTTFGGLIKDIVYEGSNAQADIEGDGVIESRELIYAVQYHTAAGKPRAALD